MKFPGCAAAAGDLTAACHALNVRGVVAIYQQRYEDAEAHLREALRGFRADDNLACVAGVLSNLSRVHAATGRADSAVDLATRGVDLRRSPGSTWRIANGRLALGIALHRAGRHAAAVSELLEALSTFGAAGQGPRPPPQGRDVLGLVDPLTPRHVVIGAVSLGSGRLEVEDDFGGRCAATDEDGARFGELEGRGGVGDVAGHDVGDAGVADAGAAGPAGGDGAGFGKIEE